MFFLKGDMGDGMQIVRSGESERKYHWAVLHKCWRGVGGFDSVGLQKLLLRFVCTDTENFGTKAVVY